MQPGGDRPISAVLPLWGLFKQTVPRLKNYSGILPKLQFPGGGLSPGFAPAINLLKIREASLRSE
jgi:hypothetical protein